jgi:hypothetical protein
LHGYVCDSNFPFFPHLSEIETVVATLQTEKQEKVMRSMLFRPIFAMSKETNGFPEASTKKIITIKKYNYEKDYIIPRSTFLHDDANRIHIRR